jgi:8-oxo-dGTP pyrophosphatase MutT (NUDIX family)
MIVVHAKQPFPERWTTAIFLAGPTPRDPAVPSWRPAALEHLRRRGFDGVVFVPEDASGEYRGDYLDQVEWECDALRFADRIVFWIPRAMDTLPGFTTNVEFGRWAASDKVVLGFPEGAPKTRYLAWLAAEEQIRVTHSLEDTLDAALLGAQPALRSGGERCVPQHIWHTPVFQAWYEALRKAGNRLESAEPLFQYRVAWSGQLFAWILKVNVWVAAEQRFKSGEWVFARADIAAAVLYRRAPVLLESEVVLVREYRAPARTSDGFVHELPGGSAPGGGDDPRALAAEEIHEETGLVIEADRLRPVGARQVAATVSAHVAHVFAAEISEAELAQARALAEAGTPHGAGGSERTVVEVTTLAAMLSDNRADWSTIGMAVTALLGPA